MADTSTRPDARGSHSVKRKTPLAWLPWLLGLLLLALLALAFLVIGAVGDDDDEGATGTGDGCPKAVDAGTQVFQDIDGVRGCRVDLTAAVVSVADDNTFVVEVGGAEAVVVDGSKGTVLTPGQEVRVLGRVDEFRFDDAADELDLVKDEADYAELEGQTVVLADATVPG